MLPVMLIDVRVKWPSERSKWLLDPAAGISHLKPTAMLHGGSADNFLLSSDDVIQLTTVGREDC